MVARLHQAKQGQIVTLGPAAGKHDLRRTTVQQLGNLLARVLDSPARLLALLMNRRGIAKLLEEVGAHRLKYLGQKRRGRVVVEIHSAHKNSCPLLVVRNSREIYSIITATLPIAWIALGCFSHVIRFGPVGARFGKQGPGVVSNISHNAATLK